jgi:hypothetical protein
VWLAHFGRFAFLVVKKEIQDFNDSQNAETNGGHELCKFCLPKSIFRRKWSN